MAGVATLEASSSVSCTPLQPSLSQGIQPEVLVVSKACRITIITNTPANRLEENIRNYTREKDNISREMLNG
jgi:hypothetical protein